ncbi:MAG: carbon-nitrogen hydrolase family protein [Myxococcales bacterium]|nr:carbon-nitrogen hydrolase family protein [Myxococcales bacterium]
MTRVTLLELPACFDDAPGQLARVDAWLSQAPAGELVLLPELSLTGYVSPRFDFDVSRFAEPVDGPTAQALAALAKKHRCALVGPMVEVWMGRHFNALVGVDPRGERFLHYRKHHPWMPETWATKGNLPLPLLDWQGLTVTAAICFDVHFLAAEEATTLRQADLLLFSSAWVAEEEDGRTELLGALAEEFDLAIVNANWGAGSPRVTGQGRSLAVDRSGHVVAETRPGQWRLDVELSALGL